MAPTRIVSLVPSLTELVVWLGRGDRLVGRTRFCTEPAGVVSAIPAMGGTKNPNIDRVVNAEPDLVIANKEENRREDIEALRAAGVNVMLTDPNSLDEALAMIHDVGEALAARERAETVIAEVREALGEASPAAEVPVYVAVWHNPMMGLGSNTYGHSLVEACGARNVLAQRERYPEVTFDELRALSPALIILPDEPFPFDENHAALYGELAPARVLDGKLLWWYGPRIPQAIRELRRLIGEVRPS